MNASLIHFPTLFRDTTTVQFQDGNAERLNGRTHIISSSDEGISVTYADLLRCLHHELKFGSRDRILEEILACWNKRSYHWLIPFSGRVLGSIVGGLIEKGDSTPE
ncbi:hypothetical protein E1B28_005911, partial [Marasmius oreades]